MAPGVGVFGVVNVDEFSFVFDIEDMGVIVVDVEGVEVFDVVAELSCVMLE